MSVVSGRTSSSVGETLSGNQIYSIQHPAYLAFAEAVSQELKEVTEREVGRLASAQVVVYTSALPSDASARLAQVYPEFAIKSIPLNSQVQSYYRASQLCANEWLATITSKYASKVVHYGGSMLASLLQSRSGTHVECDGSDEVMYNSAHSDVVDLHRLYSDFIVAKREHMLDLSRVEYSKLLSRKGYQLCYNPHNCTHKCEALCVDLSVTALSPEQVALAMLQHGAELCHGFFPYCAEMLVQSAGDIGGTGVSFVKKDVNLYFSYPEGKVGVAYYPVGVWAKWLASHCFSVGSGLGASWFQLELLKHRECFMFFRMLKVSEPGSNVSISHALDLTQNEGMTVVKSWRLKRGLRSNVTDPTQWEPHHMLVRTRTVDRVYQFAMQLPQQNFSRFAVKKQIRVVNNRWVLNGTSVSVAPSLSPELIEDLTTAIFARAFVDRYDSSRLSTQMMAELVRLNRFHSADHSTRVSIVATAVASQVYNMTVGAAKVKFKQFLDWVREAVSGSKVTAHGIAMVPAPSYVLMTSEVDAWKKVFGSNAEKFYMSEPVLDSTSVVATSMAGSLAHALTWAAPSRRSLSTGVMDVVRLCTSIVDVRLTEGRTDESQRFVDTVKSLNPVDSTTEARYNLERVQPLLEAQASFSLFQAAADPDPVGSLNDLYAECFPGVARQAMEFDTFSLSLDPQDRTLAAPYLRMSKYFGLPPVSREYYRSKLRALNIPKLQNNSQELLSAVAARNLSAPAISLPQEEFVIGEIWENFLDTMCVPDARQKLLEFQSDPVALAEDSLKDWVGKAKPGVAARVTAELLDASRSLEQMPISEYISMLKADVKPTLSNKPLTEKTAPQVIVYHEKPLSALYSSIFRVLVQRLISILKPNIFVNLLKDNSHIAQVLTAVHPFSESGLKYLENDFSKFDKSQSQFAFDLEHYAFTQLGMNGEFLDRWLAGHVDCNIRAVTVGLSLHVLYQRKSGDATTAFANVLLNVLSVAYAYRGTDVVWAVFMGDDSLACVKEVNASPDSVRILAEVFNLTAKYYVTSAPYFASSFVAIDTERLTVKLLPDPIKRVERLSMHVSALDPQWDERFMSFYDSMAGFRDAASVQQLALLVPQRYEVPEGYVRGAAAALGTLAGDKQAFRSLWESEPEVVAA